MRKMQRYFACFEALLVVILMTLPNSSYGHSISNGQNFFDERYHGWFWFEETKKNEKAKDFGATKQIEPGANQVEAQKNVNITPESAKEQIQKFAKELEDLKFMMLAQPSVENVKAYRDKEKQMWTHAEKLHDAWDMANLMYPEQRDLINNPVNVHAVKAKRELELEQNKARIKELATKVDLVLFFNSECKYCKLLSPVLQNFGKEYGFSIEAVSSDGGKHEYFKTASMPKLVERLGIRAFPTVIAVSHDGKTAFELIRGYVSISELEEYSLLAAKYLQTQGIWDKITSEAS